MLNFNPLTEEELQTLLGEGQYEFLVRNAEVHISKTSGNKSIKLTIAVYDDKGKEFLLFVYLTVNFMRLLKHFCDATGLTENYLKGQLTPQDCIGKHGLCQVAIEKQEGTAYPPKNVIKDFITSDKLAKKPQTVDFEDDALPF